MKYLYEQLNDRTFQRLCQALLARSYPGLRCFPLGQTDGGRDAASPDEFHVFQVKFTEFPDRINDAARWVISTIESEKHNLVRLYRKGMRRYTLLTNVSGTSAPDSGEIDKVAAYLHENFKTLSELRVDCWWRDTLNTHLDNAEDLHWIYPQVLAGTAAMRLLIDSLGGERAESRNRAVTAYMSQQFKDETKLKFKQAFLDSDITRLFVDVPARPTYPRYVSNSSPWLRMTAQLEAQTGEQDGGLDDEATSYPAAALLTSESPVNRILINGAPGQGKSTLLQFVCQLLRARLLGKEMSSYSQISGHFTQRVPFKVDLRDFAAWRRRRIEQKVAPDRMSLEVMIAEQVSIGSGGFTFTVEDLYFILSKAPGLIALDALDEVANQRDRNDVVTEIENTGERLAKLAPDTLVVVTSRPVVHSDIRTMPHDTYLHLTLENLPLALADKYVSKWLDNQGLSTTDASSVRSAWIERRHDSHVRDLAKNTMQLSILLHLMNARGPSLPDRRTLLYDDYVRTMLDREADKDFRVAKFRDVLLDVHGYVAFHLHGEAERSGGTGAITEDGLRQLLSEYLTRQGRDKGVEELFAGVQRVVALVSRKQGEYEFEVQPLREYFAGRFLYDSAPYVLAGVQRAGQKHDRLYRLIERPYWHNVLRFFAGCFTVGELAGLVDLLMDAPNSVGFDTVLQSRAIVATCMSDRLFVDRPQTERRAVAFAFDDIGKRVVPSQLRAGVDLAVPDTEVIRESLRAFFSEWTGSNTAEFRPGITFSYLRSFPMRMVAEEWLSVVRERPKDIGRLIDIATFVDFMKTLDSNVINELLTSIDDDVLISEIIIRGNAKVDLSDSNLRSYLHVHFETAAHWPPRPISPQNLCSKIVTLTSVELLSKAVNRRLRQSELKRLDSDEGNHPWISEIFERAGNPFSTLAWLYENFGDTWHARKLGILYASTARKNPSLFSPIDVKFDENINVVELSEFLAEGSMSADWWLSHKPHADTSAKIQSTWLLAFLTLAGASVITQLRHSCEDVAQTLPSEWLCEVAKALRYTASESFDRLLRSDEIRAELLGDAALTSLLLYPRFGREVPPKLVKAIATNLLEDTRGETRVAVLAHRAASAMWRLQRGKIKSAKNADDQLEAIRPLLRFGLDFVWSEVESRRVADLRVDAATLIMKTAQDWPRFALIEAESALTPADRPSLISIASAEEWFDDPS